MDPRTSKEKYKALAPDLQKLTPLDATAHLSAGETHRSQGLRLIALEFRLHPTSRYPTGGFDPGVRWQSEQLWCPYSIVLSGSTSLKYPTAL